MNSNLKSMVDALLNNDRDSAKEHLGQYVNAVAARIVNDMPAREEPKTVNEAEEHDNDTAEHKQVAIETVKKGTFVRKTPTSKKTYKVGDYDKDDGKYELHDEDDISRSVYVKKGTKVYVGFEY